MRSLVAILAAVMAVTTGGPLRCPCHIAALLRANSAARAVQSPAEKPIERRCGCKAHGEPQPGPTTPRPSPDHPPCQHGPGLDLAPPLAACERVGGGFDWGDPAAVTDNAGRISAAWGVHPHLPVPVTLAASPPDPLRYCHAFRC